MSQPSEAAQHPPLRARVRAEGATREFTLEGAANPLELFVRGVPEGSERSADAALALTIPFAMRRRIPLWIDQPVSARLQRGTETIQRALAAWQPGLGRVAVEAPTRSEAEAGPSRGVAAFFSGGVDSFYTLLERREELTELIFVHGFDIALEKTAIRDRAAAAAADVAAEQGLGLIEVETDIRRGLDSVLPWSMAHGVALATVALCLQERLERVLIPASYTFAEMIPWGTHPLLDRHWSTERLRFEHDGFGVDRNEKIERISSSPSALTHLRVCWENRDGAYNCGRCEKCVRTMISLRAAGALDRCKSFPSELDPKAVAALPLANPPSRAFAEQNLRALDRNGNADEIAAALRQALRRSAGLRGLPRRSALRARYVLNRLRR